MKKIVTYLVFLLFAMSGYAHAEDGLSLGLDLGARMFTGSTLSKTIDPGPGAGLNVAWNVTDFFSIRAQWLGSLHIGEGIQNIDASGTNQNTVKTTVGFHGGNIGFGFTFNEVSNIQPVIQAGIGAYTLRADYSMMNRWNTTDDFLVSWGVNLATGFDYLIKNNVSVGLRAAYLYIPFTASSGQGNLIDGSNVSFGINISYHIAGSMNHMPHMMHGGCMMKHKEKEEESSEDEEEHKH
ncbi:MAG TPA: outer membrane beta-barrel protein [bacterium]